MAGAVVAGALAAAVAGCSSGGSSSTPSATSGQASSAASSASAPAAAPSASGAGGSVSPDAASQSASGTACATQHLQAKVVNTEGAAGSVYQNIDFTNSGSTSCTLYGYPGVSLGTGMPFSQVGAAATRSTTAAPAVATLAPGQTANAVLRVVQAGNYPQATCSPTATTYLQIYPPDQTTAIYLAFNSTGCKSSTVKLLTIGAVQAGTGNGS
jgi:hypothetical protein